MKFCYLAWQASMHECMCVCIQSHKHTCVYTFVYSYIHIHALIYICFTAMYSMYIYLYNMHMQKKHAHKNHTHTHLYIYIYAFIHTVHMSSHCQGLCVGQLWPGLSANPWKNFLCSHGTLPRWLQCTARPIAAVSATVPVTKSLSSLPPAGMRTHQAWDIPSF